MYIRPINKDSVFLSVSPKPSEIHDMKLRMHRFEIIAGTDTREVEL